MKRKRATIAIAIALAAGACANVPQRPPEFRADAPAETLVAKICATCHGADGISNDPRIPRLAGQQSDYLVAQLLNFRDHSRSDPLAEQYMWPVAKNLSDVQIEALAEILAKKQAPPNIAVVEAEMIVGRRIYTEGIVAKAIPACMMCHGPAGEGFGAFPRLANQHQTYMMNQLRVFKSGHGRPDTPMAAIAPNMSEDEMLAVTGYLQGMPPP